MTILEKWGITAEQLTQALEKNPSLRGMILGYVAEQKLKEIISTLTDVSFITKFDDHNRKKKGDLKSLLDEMVQAGLGQDPEKIE